MPKENKKIRVLEIIPSLIESGAERIVEEICLNIDKSNFEIAVCCLYNFDSSIINNLKKNGVKIFFLNKKPGIDTSVFKKLSHVLESFRPDLIHTHLFHSLKYVVPIASLKRIRIIHTIHNDLAHANGIIFASIAKLSFIIFNIASVNLSNKINCTFLKLKNNFIIPNGIDLAKFKKQPKYLRHKNFTLLSIGRFEAQKNHVFLVETLARLPEQYKLILIGSGRLETKIKKRILSLQLDNRITIIGRTPTVEKYFKQADLFVLTSDWEGMPITLLESMALQVPILTSNVGAISDLVTNGKSGLFFENGSVDSCAKQILKISSSAKLRQRIVEQASQKVQSFSSKKMTEKYQKVFQIIMNSK